MLRILAFITLAAIFILYATTLHSQKVQAQISCGIQLGGTIHTQEDQRQYCLGSADGQKAANKDFQQHVKFNSAPPLQAQGLNHTSAYNEGYTNSYNDEWNIQKNG
jgi:hypothetical protein